MDGYQQARGAVVAERLRLASSAASILNEAGLPVAVDPGSARSGIALVEVDRGDDAAGGVYVSWRPGALLIERNNSHLLAGDRNHVDIDFSGQVCESMMEAMLAILRYRGVDAAVTDNDLRPYTIRVSAHGSDLSLLGRLYRSSVTVIDHTLVVAGSGIAGRGFGGGASSARRRGRHYLGGSYGGVPDIHPESLFDIVAAANKTE
jgi:hypothetical protein